MKITIVGWSGSGKSTLARAFSEKYSCDVLHLDTVNFMPNWVERTLEEKQQLVAQFLDSHDAWVIDGNYSKCSYERRAQEADLIVELLFSPLSTLYRVIKRYFMYRGKGRPDMAQGCDEKIDWTFVKWVLWKGRSKMAKQRYRNLAAQYPDKTIIIRNQKQLTKLYAEQGI